MTVFVFNISLPFDVHVVSFEHLFLKKSFVKNLISSFLIHKIKYAIFFFFFFFAEQLRTLEKAAHIFSAKKKKKKGKEWLYFTYNTFQI